LKFGWVFFAKPQHHNHRKRQKISQYLFCTGIAKIDLSVDAMEIVFVVDKKKRKEKKHTI